MLFDTTIQVVQMEMAPMEEGHLQVGLVLAIALPASTGVIPIPAGVIRFNMDKASATEKGQEMLDLAADLPDAKPKSDIVVAQSLAGVDEAVKKVTDLKGKL